MMLRRAFSRCGHTIRRLQHTQTRSEQQDSSASSESIAGLYRRYGHLHADIDPLQQTPQWRTTFTPLSTINDGPLDSALSRRYSSHIGYEFEHLSSMSERRWFIQQIESAVDSELSAAKRRNMYSLLLQSRLFDECLAVKSSTFKRYGLEGAESMIVAVQSIFETLSATGTEQVVIAMPHRGRLNLIATLLDFPLRAIFHKINGHSLIPSSYNGICDIIAHAPHQVTKKFDGVHLLTATLLANPSHLEAVNPVGLGYTRAAQQHKAESGQLNNNNSVVSLQLHGDAAFAGQGVVAESFQLSQLNDFTVGGTIHLIVNNQIGFTTFPHHARSTRYSSDVAHVVNAPVIHVNGDDPEAVVYAANVASKYRQTFHRDIVIDLVTYRRLGHNEMDEPSFTQPIMYHRIKEHPSVVTQYGDTLQRAGLLTEEDKHSLINKMSKHLATELAATTSYQPSTSSYYLDEWSHTVPATTCYDSVSTGVDTQILREIAVASVTVPKAFTIHSRLQRGHVDARIASISSDNGAIDWATGEAMAVGSLLRDGYNVRLSGQDVQRGAFSQRHFTLTDQQTNDMTTPFNQCASMSGSLAVVNSNLSEFAVLGFEYGYSWYSPRTLCIWEAQFGDFVNGAQIIVDQFISNGESKWLKPSGIVLLLPHGMDGAGADHSSGRLERFLQASDDQTAFISEDCANIDVSNGNAVNMVIVNPTTPAQYFHLLRRQMLRPYRKPLIIMSPKVLLRHSQCVSRFNDFNAPTMFQPVLIDFNGQTHISDRQNVRIVVFLSGKAYYDVIARRQAGSRRDIAVVRIEELSPFPYNQIRQILSAQYDQLQHIVWFQEEHANAGAWTYVQPRFNCILSKSDCTQKAIKYVGRRPLCAAAVGSNTEHKQEIISIYQRLFGL